MGKGSPNYPSVIFSLSIFLRLYPSRLPFILPYVLPTSLSVFFFFCSPFHISTFINFPFYCYSFLFPCFLFRLCVYVFFVSLSVCLIPCPSEHLFSQPFLSYPSPTLHFSNISSLFSFLLPFLFPSVPLSCIHTFLHFTNASSHSTSVH